MKKQIFVIAASLIMAMSSVVGIQASVFGNDNSFVKHKTFDYTTYQGAEMQISADATKDDSRILLSFDFYGDQVEVEAVKNEYGKYEVTKGCFFALDGSRAAEQAVKSGNWQ